MLLLHCVRTSIIACASQCPHGAQSDLVRTHMAVDVVLMASRSLSARNLPGSAAEKDRCGGRPVRRGLLRRYFPEGTNLAGRSREHLDEVAAGLNSRPRKTLGWKTPPGRWTNSRAARPPGKGAGPRGPALATGRVPRSVRSRPSGLKAAASGVAAAGGDGGGAAVDARVPQVRTVKSPHISFSACRPRGL